MISKAQLLAIATESGLLPTTVEKDYALSWVLFGISRHQVLNRWVFKGGTCLKKCYFDTYRFSEDLDFTIPTECPYDHTSILTSLKEMCANLSQLSGIEFPEDEIDLKESINKRNNRTYQGKITFVGPLNPPKSNRQRIKLDLTQDEVIVDPSQPRHVFHPYADAPTEPFFISSYSINEILAEKSRALFERSGTPRDVYDVVNVSRNFRSDVDPARARTSLNKKFEFKGLPAPTTDLIHAQVDPPTLLANWEPSLGHQLRIAPPAKEFLDELKDALGWWIDGTSTISLPLAGGANEERIAQDRFTRPTVFGSPSRVGIGGKISSHAPLSILGSSNMEVIRFSARNRLLVSLSYNGVRRIVEPYSLRRPKTGNLLLYVYEVNCGGGTGGGIKAFQIGMIRDAQPTSTPFYARYQVEL